MSGRRGRTRAVVGWTSGLVAAGLVVTGAVVAAGYDAEDLPTVESTVWVSRNPASGQQYAAVNTDLAEIVSVNDADGIEGVAQAGSAGVVLGSGWSRYWAIDGADPADIGVEEQAADGTPVAGDGAESPTGTLGALAVGDAVLFQGSSPALLPASDLGDEDAAWTDLSAFVGDDYEAAASTLSTSGRVALYSTAADERRVTVVDPTTGVVTRFDVADAPESASGVELTFVGERWVLLERGAEVRLWSDAGGPFAVSAGVDALLQTPGAAADGVVLAWSEGAAALDLDDGGVLAEVQAAGEPARPAAFGDRVVAAWLSQGAAAMWTTGQSAPIELEIEGGAFDDDVDVIPVLSGNGDRAVLVESTTGMAWTAPDGVLISVDQWTADEPQELEGEIVEEELDPTPPVAEPDDFGVRTGAVVSLPVLYNDHDANPNDVLSVDPASVTGLDPAFGSLSLAGDNQTIVVSVSGGGQTTASFEYRVTDGVSTSAPARVTLTVRTGDSPPVWCGDLYESCSVEWPSPQLAVGGTASFDVVKGWIDPEGDAIVVASATPADTQALRTIPGDDGALAIAHTDAGGAGGEYTVPVTVMDARGAVSAARDLVVRVSAVPGFTLDNGVVVGRAGEPATATIDDYASGGSGAYRIVDAVRQGFSAAEADLVWNANDGTVRLTASEPGEYMVKVSVQDAATPNRLEGYLRFSIGDDAGGGVSVPPLVVFVVQGEDVVVDVLGAVQNTTDRVLFVDSAVALDARLAVSVIDEHGVQVRAADDQATPGPLGRISVTVADADGNTYPGELNVFLVAATTAEAPIAMPDDVTVRAGAIVDVDVLANDVSPRGERPALHPDVASDGPDDALAFASGDTLRYVAPLTPGTYVVAYYAYLPSAPALLSRAEVTIEVVPQGANRAPTAVDIEARGLAGATIEIPVDVTRMDPDGDPVTVVSVTQPEAAHGAVMLGDDGRTILFVAAARDKENPVPGWQAAFEYTVRDASGATSTATVRVAVSAKDPTDLAPIVFTDRVRVEAGVAVDVAVEPLANDRDPATGAAAATCTGLHILGEVVPNMSGYDAATGEVAASTPAAAAQALLDAAGPTEPGEPLCESSAAGDAEPETYPDGVVRLRVAADTLPGDYVYRYTVESLQTRSTAQGLIIVTVSEGASPELPTIEDTVVTVETRHLLEGAGILVLDGSVDWATGDPATLTATLELAPGAPAGFTVTADGRIRGALPEVATTVPFQVTGFDPSGEQFTAYGLLRVPAFDDFRLQVERRPEPIPETESEPHIDLAEILAIADGDEVEVSPDSSFAIHRGSQDPLAPASCSLEPGSTSVLVYAAGYMPGMATDTCTVLVRLVGQSDDAWSTVVVPIDVSPVNPQALLTPITRTVSVSPSQERIDLYDALVSWVGGFELPDLDSLEFSWQVVSGSSFTVSPASSGSGTGPDTVLSLLANADARPGTRNEIRVTLEYPYPDRPGVADPGSFQASTTIVVNVGMVVAGAPSGASLELACDAQRQPEGCAVQAILAADASGQYNPNTGLGNEVPLRLVGVGGALQTSAACGTVATATIEGDSLRFAWQPGEKPAGGRCEVTFTVQDAQGRTGTGRVAFTGDGYPRVTDQPVTTSYTADSVTLTVPLGQAAQSYPAVTGVVLYEGGVAVADQSCEPLDAGSYRCVVSGLDNGVRHDLVARAVNGLGYESSDSAAHATWAYGAAAFRSGPDYDDQVFSAATSTTSGTVHVVDLCLDNAAATQTTSVRLRSGSWQLDAVVDPATGCLAASPLELTGLPVGAATITATPLSGLGPPIGTGGQASATRSIVVRGAPAVTALTATVNAAATAVDVALAVDTGLGDAAPLGGDAVVEVRAWREGEAPATCQAADAGGFTGNTVTMTGGDATRSDSAVASGYAFSFAIGADLDPNVVYEFRACVSFGYGWAASQTASVRTLRMPGAPVSAQLTYTPAARPTTMDAYRSDDGARVVTWTVPDEPPTSDFVFTNAPADAAPGTGWQLRFADRAEAAAFASDAAGMLVGAAGTVELPSIGGTWYARWCFTEDGEDFCSEPSAAITQAPGTNVGIDVGQSASVAMPASCSVALAGLNAEVAASGDQAVAAARTAYQEDARESARSARMAELYPDADFADPPGDGWGYTYVAGDPNPKAASGDADLVAVYDAFIAAFDEAFGVSGDAATARGEGRAAARVLAEARAADAGQAASDLAAATFDEATHAAGVRAAAESARFDELEAGAAASAPPVTITGFTVPPLAVAPDAAGAVRVVTTGARFDAFAYDLTAAVAGSASTQYVADGLVAALGAEYTCG